MTTPNINFSTLRYNTADDEELEQLSEEQRRILQLDMRAERLEHKVAHCHTWMRIQAEREAKKLNPGYVVHEPMLA